MPIIVRLIALLAEFYCENYEKFDINWKCINENLNK